MPQSLVLDAVVRLLGAFFEILVAMRKSRGVPFFGFKKHRSKW